MRTHLPPPEPNPSNASFSPFRPSRSHRPPQPAPARRPKPFPLDVLRQWGSKLDVRARDIAGAVEQSLIASAQSNDPDAVSLAGNTLLRAHADFIAMAAYKLGQRKKRHDLLRGDLLAEAQQGFWEAVLKYDFRRGVRLTTYAAWWMRHQVYRVIDDVGYTIHVPVNKTEGPYERWRPEAQAARAMFSLDKEVLGLDNHVTYLELLPDESATPEEIAGRSMCHAAVKAALGLALSKLTPQEQRAIRLAFYAKDDLTYQEVADAMGISRQRVQQLQGSALVKLHRLLQGERHLIRDAIGGEGPLKLPTRYYVKPPTTKARPPVSGAASPPQARRAQVPNRRAQSAPAPAP